MKASNSGAIPKMNQVLKSSGKKEIVEKQPFEFGAQEDESLSKSMIEDPNRLARQHGGSGDPLSGSFRHESKPSFMMPTKSSVHKGSIVPNTGEVSSKEIIKNFHHTIRGSKNTNRITGV